MIQFWFQNNSYAYHILSYKTLPKIVKGNNLSKLFLIVKCNLSRSHRCTLYPVIKKKLQ